MSVKYKNDQGVVTDLNGVLVKNTNQTKQIIKSFTYTGTGTDTASIMFPEEPAFVVGIVGWSYSHGILVTAQGFVWGAKRVTKCWYNFRYGSDNSCETDIVAYNGLTMTMNGVDSGSASNWNGIRYTVYYIAKSDLNVRKVTYLGDGSTQNTITFTETPSFILGIIGNEADDGTNDIRAFDPFIWGAPVGASLYAASGASKSYRTCNAVDLSYSDNAMTLERSGRTAIDVMNKSGVSYDVYYVTDDDIEIREFTYTPSASDPTFELFGEDAKKIDDIGVIIGCNYSPYTNSVSVCAGMCPVWVYRSRYGSTQDTETLTIVDNSPAHYLALARSSYAANTSYTYYYIPKEV